MDLLRHGKRSEVLQSLSEEEELSNQDFQRGRLSEEGLQDVLKMLAHTRKILKDSGLLDRYFPLQLQHPRLREQMQNQSSIEPPQVSKIQNPRVPEEG
jgi:hypothetical protein